MDKFFLETFLVLHKNGEATGRLPITMTTTKGLTESQWPILLVGQEAWVHKRQWRPLHVASELSQVSETTRALKQSLSNQEYWQGESLPPW